MKKKHLIVPGYAWLPIICTFVMNMVTFYGSRLITRNWKHYTINLPLDERIPFVPAAIVVYVLCYAYWVVGFVVIARESRSVCYRLFAGEQIAKLICLLIFLVWPTCLVRPEIVGNDFFSQLTQFIYLADTPDNLFPSIHCLDSWIVFRGLMRCRKVGKGYKLGSFVFTLLIFASTLLVKQHLILDVFGGVVVAEAGLWLADRLKAWRIYERIYDRRGERT